MYLLRAEGSAILAGDWRGPAGPHAVSALPGPQPVTRAFVQSCQELGMPLNPDFNGPEQAGGGADASGPRGDVYALGVVLYELLAGARPRDLSDLSTTGALETLRRDPVVPVATHRPDLPVDLQIIVAKVLAQSADARYDTVAALREDIGRFRSRRPILARPPGAWRRATLFVRRHPVGVAASAIVARWRAQIIAAATPPSEVPRTPRSSAREVSSYSSSSAGRSSCPSHA